MATGYIYSNYGYDERDGERGHFEYYAGRPWWLPYQKVTAIPNFTLRELDHDKSTPEKGETGQLVYMTVIVPGGRIVEELCNKQKPISNREMGIVPITGKPTGKTVEVLSGWDEEGRAIMTEVPEREPTKSELAEAESLTESYKRRIIADYFQAKRERMTGGRGALHPSPIVRLFMEELAVEDIDDVSAHAKNVGGMDPELLKAFAEMIMKAGQVKAVDLHEAVESVRKAGKATVAPTKLAGNRYESKHLDLAGHKAAYEAAEKAREAEAAAKSETKE